MTDRRPTCIVAYIRENGQDATLRQAARRLAAEHGARLVLYDADAGSTFSEPLPSNWAAEGVREEYGDLLGPDELEALGRPELRDEIRSARSSGLDAHGWLAGTSDADELAGYATKIGADLVLLPQDLAEPSLVDRVTRRDPDPATKLELAIAFVADDGRIDYR